ncbi:MAG TPA: hydrogenase expression protein HypE [Xanthobacteraceae bacterium]|jgi:Ni,Fe-hydrogenase III large subunit|nr:hydrogenase expression protein HypE [Xanthobacteraceae bacterium]
MSLLSDIIEQGQRVAAHRPWPRAVVTADTWQRLRGELAEGKLTLIGLWGDIGIVHMALLDEAGPDIGVVSLECPDGRFPAIGFVHKPAARLERAVRDLFGLEPSGLGDVRPWLDHSRWDLWQPLGNGSHEPRPSQPYAFLPVEGEGLHQIPVGPVHAGIIEPGHFRFTANGEAVVRLEERLGYVHKGIESLMVGADLARGIRLAGRTSGDSTVAYALAFAHAAEAALGLSVPPRAAWLRALMAELERLANHFGDFGAICNDASFAIMHAQCGILRERTLRVAATCFGHRLMMDRIMPGGISNDVPANGLAQLRELIAEIQRSFPRLVALYDNTASLQDRTVTTGVLKAALARQFGAGGFVGRASGRAFDARRALAYPPYDQLAFEVPVVKTGDVNARVWIRIHEIEQSMRLIDQIIASLPEGPLSAPAEAAGGAAAEGLGIVEGFRGDVLVWLRLDGERRIARCHLRDPSWFQWPLLEAVIEGNIVADFPICNKSFNCSYSGHDL